MPRDVVAFLKRQSFIIFSTVDEKGRPHSVAKGIVEIDKNGVVFLLDLYRARTYANLLRNANASVTARALCACESRKKWA